MTFVPTSKFTAKQATISAVGIKRDIWILTICGIVEIALGILTAVLAKSTGTFTIEVFLAFVGPLLLVGLAKLFVATFSR